MTRWISTNKARRLFEAGVLEAGDVREVCGGNLLVGGGTNGPVEDKPPYPHRALFVTLTQGNDGDHAKTINTCQGDSTS